VTFVWVAGTNINQRELTAVCLGLDSHKMLGIAGSDGQRNLIRRGAPGEALNFGGAVASSFFLDVSVMRKLMAIEVEDLGGRIVGFELHAYDLQIKKRHGNVGLGAVLTFVPNGARGRITSQSNLSRACAFAGSDVEIADGSLDFYLLC